MPCRKERENRAVENHLCIKGLTSLLDRYNMEAGVENYIMRPKILPQNKERSISVPESEYKNYGNLKKRQAKTKKLAGKFWNMYRDTK